MTYEQLMLCVITSGMRRLFAFLSVSTNHHNGISVEGPVTKRTSPDNAKIYVFSIFSSQYNTPTVTVPPRGREHVRTMNTRVYVVINTCRAEFTIIVICQAVIYIICY